MKITPALAQKFLAKASSNRSISRATVRRYRDAMSAGEWQLTMETLKFDHDGNLFDGQHRLTACVEAQVPFETYVIQNADPASITSLDTGRRRTNGDYLGIKGISHGVQLASMAKYLRDLLLIEKGDCSIPSFGKRPLGQAELLSTVEEYGALLEEARTYVFAGSTRLLQSPSVFGALYMRLSGIHPNLTKDFFEILLSSPGMRSGYKDRFYAADWTRNPIFALRHVLETMEEAKHTHHSRGKVRPEALVNVTIRAWNAWICGKPLSNVDAQTDSQVLIDAIRDPWPEIQFSGSRVVKNTTTEDKFSSLTSSPRPRRRVVGAAATAVAKKQSSKSGL